MGKYQSPTVELITFNDDMVLWSSNCNCQYSGYDEVVDTDSPLFNKDCGAASWHASENPWHIPSPEYGQEP